MKIVNTFLYILATSYAVSSSADPVAPSDLSPGFSWPNGAKAAISLSYDDALPSQLDNAVKHLNNSNLKGSFYLTLSAPTIKNRLAEWQAVAAHGHELANHSINHPCRASLPNREWVEDKNDLDNITVTDYLAEILTANRWLNSIDGETKRTLTLPCGDALIGSSISTNTYSEKHNEKGSKKNKGKLRLDGVSILPLLTRYFVGIKTSVSDLPTPKTQLNTHNVAVWAPSNTDGHALIGYAKKAASNGGIGNYTFHGIGGDHLAISNKAHQTLLTHLANNPNIYWVATFKEIAQYIHSQRALQGD